VFGDERLYAPLWIDEPIVSIYNVAVKKFQNRDLYRSIVGMAISLNIDSAKMFS
jgi:hypothetical protein